jgi:hypothetical protein
MPLFETFVCNGWSKLTASSIHAPVSARPKKDMTVVESSVRFQMFPRAHGTMHVTRLDALGNVFDP